METNMGKTTLKSMTLTSKEKVNELQSGVLYFIDEGKEVRIFEENALPIASSSLLGNIYRYTGETTNEYKNGAFYNVIKFGENYSWREVYGLNLDLNLDPKTDKDTVEVHYDLQLSDYDRYSSAHSTFLPYLQSEQPMHIHLPAAAV